MMKQMDGYGQTAVETGYRVEPRIIVEPNIRNLQIVGYTTSSRKKIPNCFSWPQKRTAQNNTLNTHVKQLTHDQLPS
jgi:hypothetical protein